MDEFALTAAERRLFRALDERGVRFLVIGLSAAGLEGAPVAMQGIDIWLERIDERVAQAAADAKGSAFGGPDLARIDVVLTAHGLNDFATSPQNPRDPSFAKWTACRSMCCRWSA